MVVRLARADDWMAVYIDGKCVWQTHSIQEEDLLDLLKIDYISVWAQSQADEDGAFPQYWDEVISDENYDDIKGFIDNL